MGLRADQSQRLVALFVFGALLLTFPLLALFNVNTSVGGIPLLYAYLFSAWGLLIGLLRWAARLPPEPGLAHDVSHERGSEAATARESRRRTPPEAGRQPR